MLRLLNAIKVDKKIKPLAYSARTRPELVVGADYFVSFEKNIAYPCKLIRFDEKGVSIEIAAKSKSKKRVIGQEGALKESHNLNLDCLGTTPENAVMNQGNLGLGK